MTKLAIINKDTNLVENISIDDRPINEIVLPDPYFALDQETTTSITYFRNPESKEIVTWEAVGEGNIGYTWDGEKLIGPQPKSL